MKKGFKGYIQVSPLSFCCLGYNSPNVVSSWFLTLTNLGHLLPYLIKMINII